MVEYTDLYLICNRNTDVSSQHIIKKTPVRLQRFDDLKFEPRFEFGHMAESSEICGFKDGSELGAGFVRMHNAHIPWTIQYDEIFEMFERDSICSPAGKMPAVTPFTASSKSASANAI